MFLRHTDSCYRQQRGTAIIMAMLTVALVATLATAILADYGHAVDQLGGRHDQAQARWLAKAAVDWGRNVLESDYLREGVNHVDHLREDWATKVPATPFEDGEISGELQDQSGCFNLNSLVNVDGTVDADQTARFKRLLVALGITQADAVKLTNSLIDWIDSNDEIAGQTGGSETASYRQDGSNARVPPQSYMLDVAEIQFVHGFSPQIVQLLRPHITAVLASDKQINVNTATAPVLQAYVEDLTAAQATALILNRERSFFTSVNNFVENLPSTPKSTSSLAVTSTFFLATGRARWGESVSRVQALLYRSQAKPRPDILWVKIQ